MSATQDPNTAPEGATSLSTKVVRGAIIAAVCTTLLAASLWLCAPGAKPWRRLLRPSWAPAEEPNSATVRLNDRTSSVKTYHSPLSPTEVVDRLARAARRGGRGRRERPVFVQHDVDGRSFLSFRDDSGRYVSVIASAHPRGGTRYMVARGESDAWSGAPNQDASGQDMPDVPRPPDSWRVFCLESPAGSGRFMILYKGYNAAAATQRFYLRRMAELGWSHDGRLSAQLSRANAQLETAAATDSLAFSKARRRCIISMSDRPGNVVATTILVR